MAAARKAPELGARKALGRADDPVRYTMPVPVRGFIRSEGAKIGEEDLEGDDADGGANRVAGTAAALAF